MSARPCCSKRNGRCAAVVGSAARKLSPPFAGLPRVTLEESASAAKALDWTRRGMDFAAALHLAKAEGCDALISVDQRFAALANVLSEVRFERLDGWRASVGRNSAAHSAGEDAKFGGIRFRCSALHRHSAAAGAC
jgi:hypothetical protein